MPLVKLESDYVPEDIHIAFSFLVFLKNQLFLPSSERALILSSKIWEIWSHWGTELTFLWRKKKTNLWGISTWKCWRQFMLTKVPSLLKLACAYGRGKEGVCSLPWDMIVYCSGKTGRNSTKIGPVSHWAACIFVLLSPTDGNSQPSLQVCQATCSLRVPKRMLSGKRWRRQQTEWRFAGYLPSPLLLFFFILVNWLPGGG